MIYFLYGVDMTKEEFIKTIIKKLKNAYKKLSDEEKFFKKSKAMCFYIYICINLPTSLRESDNLLFSPLSLHFLKLSLANASFKTVTKGPFPER